MKKVLSAVLSIFLLAFSNVSYAGNHGIFVKGYMHPPVSLQPLHLVYKVDPPWYVRDGGGPYGTTSTTCNGTTNAVFTGNNGPNCAVNDPGYILGWGCNSGVGSACDHTGPMVGGDTLYIDGDSDTTWDFKVAGVVTPPAVGDEYINNGQTFTITVVNLLNGVGTISASSGVNEPPSTAGYLSVVSGHGSGDTTLKFTSSTGSQAQYAVGYSGSHSGTIWYYDYNYCLPGESSCTLGGIPAGTSSQQTSVIGTGTHKPQLYGINGPYNLLVMNNGYVTLQWIELTQHFACGLYNSVQPCGGNGINAGILLGGTGNILTDVYIHRISTNAINGGTMGTSTFTRLWLIGNAFGGFQFDTQHPATDTVTGTLTFNQPIIDWNGCVEQYPATYPGIENPLNYKNCWNISGSADYPNGGFGDALSAGATGNNAVGNWIIEGPGSISFNTKDAISTIHGVAANSIFVDKIRLEGNGGFATKIANDVVNFTNNMVVANCGWWWNAPQTMAGAMSVNYGGCRAGGSAWEVYIGNGYVLNFFNNTIVTNYIAFELNGNITDGTPINIENNIVVGGQQWSGNPAINSSGGGGLDTFYYFDNGSGNVVEDHNIVFGVKDTTDCAGAHDICTQPAYLFSAGNFPNGVYNVGQSSYYGGYNAIPLLTLAGNSVATGAGASWLYNWNTANDYYNQNRTEPPSIGGLEANSCAANAYTCFANSDCCSGSCSNNYCVGNGTVTKVSPAKDNVIVSTAPTTNYSSNSSFTFSGSNGSSAGYTMQYNVAPYQGRTVTRAYMYLWTNRGGQHANTLYRLLPTGFSPAQSTWNVSSTGNNWNTAGALGAGIDYTTQDSTTGYSVQTGNYASVDVTALLNDCIASGNSNCNLLMRWPSGSYYDTIDMASSANPPYIVVASKPTNTYFNWYVRDGGGNFGTSSTTCNGTSNTIFTGSNGPNCAVNSLTWLLGTSGGTLPYVSSGDTINLDGDSDISWYFTVSGVITLPAIGDTYTTGGVTYTVVQTLATGLTAGNMILSGPSVPPSSGTLTVVTGSGTSPIPYTSIGIGQAQYMVGLGAPGMGPCVYGCTMNSIPAGPSATALTKVLGTGSQRPQLWGTNGINGVLYATNGNTDLENLEITDHSPCSTSSGDPGGIVDGVSPNCNNSIAPDNAPKSTTWASEGLYLGGNNLVTKNNYIHRFAYGNIEFNSNIQNWTTQNDIVVASGGGGALTQAVNAGANSESFGPAFNNMINDLWAFGGCGEHYPTPYPNNPLDYRNYHHCGDQNQGGDYALGGGFMMQSNAAACGSWNFINSRFLYNLKTNIDFLHCSSIGTLNFIRSRSEGSSGEAMKLGGGGTGIETINIEESQLIGDAVTWYQPNLYSIVSHYDINGNSIAGQYNLIMCRGGASTIWTTHPGMTVNFINSDIEGNCTALVEISAPDNSCTGTTFNAYNTKFIGGEFWDANGDHGALVDLVYNAGDDGNGDGNCGASAITMNMHNSSCYHAASYAGFGCSSGTNMVTSDPLITGEEGGVTIPQIVGPTSYYNGITLGDLFYLQSGSPLIGQASTSAPITNGSFYDYNSHAPNSPLDIGALQSTTCVRDNGNLCSVSSGQCCGSQTCSSTAPPGSCPVASGTCTPNGGSSSIAALCCSGVSFNNTCVSAVPTVPTMSSINGSIRGNLGR